MKSSEGVRYTFLVLLKRLLSQSYAWTFYPKELPRNEPKRGQSLQTVSLCNWRLIPMNTKEQRHNDRQGNPSNRTRAGWATDRVAPRAGPGEPPAPWVAGITPAESMEDTPHQLPINPITDSERITAYRSMGLTMGSWKEHFGVCKTYYGMFKGRTKDTGRERSNWTGEEQVWENTEERG